MTKLSGTILDGSSRPEQIARSDLRRQARPRWAAPKGRGPGWAEQRRGAGTGPRNESKKAPAPGSLRVEVQTRVRAWAPRARDIATWAGTAVGRRAAGGELGVRVVGSAESRRLNARYRGKDKPTNVLSFPPAPLPGRLTGAPAARDGQGTDYSARPGLRPFGAAKRGSAWRYRSRPAICPRPLGDLVICAQVVRSEARAQGKPLEAHWAHLVVHGALHLIGYDHEREAEAKRMERREIAVLRRLGYSNPYRI